MVWGLFLGWYRLVAGRWCSVGSTDTAASPLFIKQGPSTVCLLRRGGRVETVEGVVRGVVSHDTIATGLKNRQGSGSVMAASSKQTSDA